MTTRLARIVAAAGFGAALAATSALWAAARADDLGVVASIKPVHSLVAGVMAGVGTPSLIVKGGATPHAYSLKPSEASALEDARLVVWVGPQLESFLAEPIETLASDAMHLALIETKGVTLLKRRDDEAFEAHEEHEEDEEHAHGGTEAHVWLDPINAKTFVIRIAEELAAIDPANAATYRRNAETMRERLQNLRKEVAAELRPVHDRPFLVFHDAYHYFEHRFDVHAAGSITLNPEQSPSARRVREIRDKIDRLHVACVFSEPQFEPGIVRTVTEGMNVKTGVLDPLGASLADGPELYFELLRNLAHSLKDCLSPRS